MPAEALFQPEGTSINDSGLSVALQLYSFEDFLAENVRKQLTKNRFDGISQFYGIVRDVVRESDETRLLSSPFSMNEEGRKTSEKPKAVAFCEMPGMLTSEILEDSSDLENLCLQRIEIFSNEIPSIGQIVAISFKNSAKFFDPYIVQVLPEFYDKRKKDSGSDIKKIFEKQCGYFFDLSAGKELSSPKREGNPPIQIKLDGNETLESVKKTNVSGSEPNAKATKDELCKDNSELIQAQLQEISFDSKVLFSLSELFAWMKKEIGDANLKDAQTDAEKLIFHLNFLQLKVSKKYKFWFAPREYISSNDKEDKEHALGKSIDLSVAVQFENKFFLVPARAIFGMMMAVLKDRQVTLGLFDSQDYVHLQNSESEFKIFLENKKTDLEKKLEKSSNIFETIKESLQGEFTKNPLIVPILEGYGK